MAGPTPSRLGLFPGVHDRARGDADILRRPRFHVVRFRLGCPQTPDNMTSTDTSYVEVQFLDATTNIIAPLGDCTSPHHDHGIAGGHLGPV